VKDRADVLVDFSDFATLVTAWNSQDTYHDIGPATGAVPDLVPASDGVIDFEDLTVYLQMWSWSAAVNAGAMAEEVPNLARAVVEQTDRHAPVMVNRRHPITLEQPEPDDLWAPDAGLLDLNLEARDVAGLTSAGFIIHYDTEHLALLDVQPGTFLGRAGGQDETLVAIKRIDEELGRIELMYGRLDEVEPPRAEHVQHLAAHLFEAPGRRRQQFVHSIRQAPVAICHGFRPAVSAAADGRKRPHDPSLVRYLKNSLLGSSTSTSLLSPNTLE